MVMDHSKYLDHILNIDPKNKRITVQSGVINDDVNEALEPYNLVFPRPGHA
ncbi:hypothetical protein HSBAA_09290 [Vreelandella sulfidaeris]|uniref:FAD linked oxidase N-terminal domain-containing protein n=1 Tax=Vreelandella sulfidaeris TaxID=115553 RepID=A0A455U365_9GAMM|nr:hypothetical protein HSBAA_09290 [Halomonas sulfidaeris]